MISGKKIEHLVFDAETKRYRIETTSFSSTNDVNPYSFSVETWNGKQNVRWEKLSIENGSGGATIRPHSGVTIPGFAVIFYDWYNGSKPYDKTVPTCDPKLDGSSGDTIFIHTTSYKLGLSKRTGSLKSLTIHELDSAGKKTDRYNEDYFADHVERSGIWIPLRVSRNLSTEGYKRKEEYIVEPKTLRLLDKVDDSVFEVSLKAGCGVYDYFKKRAYTVTTLDTNPPQDIEDLKKMLDTMLKQAEEQKNAVEKKK
jgi:hypothetical protein